MRCVCVRQLNRHGHRVAHEGRRTHDGQLRNSTLEKCTATRILINRHDRDIFNWTIFTIYDSFVFIIICLATNWTLQKKSWNLCATCVHKFTMKSRRRTHTVSLIRDELVHWAHTFFVFYFFFFSLSVVRFSAALRRGKTQSMIIIDCEILFSLHVLWPTLIDSSMRGTSECVRSESIVCRNQMIAKCISHALPHHAPLTHSSKPTPHKKQQTVCFFRVSLKWIEMKWSEKRKTTKRNEFHQHKMTTTKSKTQQIYII